MRWLTRIDGAGDQGTMTDRGGDDPDNYQLNVDVNGYAHVFRNDDANNIKPLVVSAAKLDGTNYKLEAQIPFEAIPDLDIRSGMGFSVSFVDADAARDAGGWNHILWQGEIEHEPTQWGKMMFADPLAVDPAAKLATAWGSVKR